MSDFVPFGSYQQGEIAVSRHHPVEDPRPRWSASNSFPD